MLDTSLIEVRTNIEKTNWLKYIIEEFRRIHQAKFDIAVLGTNDISRTTNFISYGEHDHPETDIPNFSNQPVSHKSVFISDELFVMSNTIAAPSEKVLNYDLFWNAFVFLSRKEEFDYQKQNRSIRSYRYNHPRFDGTTFEVPIVNLLFLRFEQFILKKFPNLSFGISPKPVIQLTHDLDYLKKTPQLLLKQTAFNLFNVLRGIASIGNTGRNLKVALRFLFSNPDYWQFDYWRDLESRYGFQSTFFIYSKVSSNTGLRSWMIDPSYDVSKNSQLTLTLKQLIDAGFNVGLHGSFNSATDQNLLRLEKENLEMALETGITKTRQHWLNYHETLTPCAHEDLFLEDFTLGWNDQMGFRAGVASRFRPYDHQNDRPFNHYEIPQLIMDSHIYDYGQNETSEKLRKAIGLLGKLQKLKGCNVAISWHPRTASSDYNWNQSYEQILKVVKE